MSSSVPGPRQPARVKVHSKYGHTSLAGSIVVMVSSEYLIALPVALSSGWNKEITA